MRPDHTSPNEDIVQPHPSLNQNEYCKTEFVCIAENLSAPSQIMLLVMGVILLIGEKAHNLKLSQRDLLIIIGITAAGAFISSLQ
jgi:hypothetical protein